MVNARTPSGTYPPGTVARTSVPVGHRGGDRVV
jgi:hypothetical protein